MQFEHQDLSLWFGTADTPAPSETVSAGSEATITIAVQPISASNRVELIYRVNQGSTERLAAQRRPSHSSISQSQYFIARLPAFSAGDLVEYSAICHCAGRQVPSPEEAEHFAGSFRVTEPGTQVATIAANESLPVETVAAVDRSPAEVDATTPSPSPHLETRINTIKTFLNHEEHQQAVDLAMRAANGDMPTAIKNLTEKLPVASLQTIALAHSLAELSDDHMPVVKALTEHPDVNNLRDVALCFNAENLATLVEPKAVSESIAGATDDEKKQNFAVALQHKLFAAEPTAVLQRMVQEAEVPIADANVRSGVASFLDNQPDFNIRTTSVYTALQHPEAFKDIAEEDRPGVVEHLKTLQRVQAISPVPEAVPILMRANLTTAFHVTEMPESTFLKSYGSALGEETARQVYTSATNSRIRNEQALITMRETMRGTGLAIMDGSESLATRITRLQSVADRQAVPLNLEALFGSIDFCECDECLSVYSPASYFVEILQYLRNNNLDPTKTKSDPKDIKDTPLEKLFRRRPDLGCLELTCQNTFTVLPYVDLVNEVNVHLSEYTSSNLNPNLRESRLETFNIEDETTSELLAQPQHINYDAYCILKNAVYPFTLPYHQPIDAIRIFLNYLGTSFYELLDTYRTATETCTKVVLTPAKQQELQTLHRMMLDRAVDAEFLGLTQEEYIILTKKAFWPKDYFEITLQQSLTDQEYQQKIGVQDVHEYYGYKKEKGADMLSLDETQKLGLTFVKKQFLPRTGIQYIDLVELLKTQFVNPNYPQGKALTILEGIRFSYRFLQTLVDTNSSDPQSKYAKLIAFLEYAQPLVPQIDAMRHPDPCKQHNLDGCMETKDLRNWVYCYFERIGRLIVLESGEGPQLPIEGQLFFIHEGQSNIAGTSHKKDLVGTLHKDGRIVDNDGILRGNVTFTGRVVKTDGQPFFEKSDGFLEIVDEKSNKIIGHLSSAGLEGIKEERLNWLPAQDTCDLKKVRLVHLDGSAIAVEEYDRIQRFIRLWHKMGWTIDETDRALTGLSASDRSGTIAVDCNFVSFEAFGEDCPSSDDKETEDCPSIAIVDYQITPDFLHQLVAVRKLLDLTGLPLIKLLTFWANISTVGEKSLYSRLFLTHNLLGIDKVFQADKHGNYLTQSAKITDRLPVLMAALKLKADDITAMMSFHPRLPDALTLPNVSLLYRYSLLAKVLHVKVTELPDVIDLFGNPFRSAWNALDLLETWGKMEDAGFNFRQLNYIIQDRDDKLRPLKPSKRAILQITKTLYDGLNGIDRDHQDVHKEEEATADLIRTKASLLFTSAVVEKILGLLEGTTVYSTNAPVNLSIKIPESQKTLAKKLKYSYQKEATPPSAGLQVTGILTPEEQTQAKALSSDPKWAKAIDRIGKQPQNIFNDALLGVFPEQVRVEAKSKLLAGDVLPTDGNPPSINNSTSSNIFYHSCDNNWHIALLSIL